MTNNFIRLSSPKHRYMMMALILLSLKPHCAVGVSIWKRSGGEKRCPVAEAPIQCLPEEQEDRPKARLREAHIASTRGGAQR